MDHVSFQPLRSRLHPINYTCSLDLGPEFVYEALRTDPDALLAAEGRSLRFLANVDPVDIARALAGLDPESTLVVVVSKTFTTAETMLNARTLKRWLIDSIPGHSEASVIRKHMVAVRCDDSSFFIANLTSLIYGLYSALLFLRQ